MTNIQIEVALEIGIQHLNAITTFDDDANLWDIDRGYMLASGISARVNACYAKKLIDYPTYIRHMDSIVAARLRLENEVGKRLFE